MEFVDSLTREQRQAAIFPYESDQRYDWHYVPRPRKGIAWKAMSATQRDLAVKLLRSSISEPGYRLTEDIRDLETVLRELERNPGRDIEQYFFTFYGTPSRSGRWAWRYEGHHISLIFVFDQGKMIATTPQFLGTNPATQAGNGKRPLGPTQDLAFSLMDSLTSEQRKRTVISERPYPDIVTTNARRAVIPEAVGIPYSELFEGQKKALRDLIAAHSKVQLKAEQDRRTKRIEEFDLAKLKFAWAGRTDKNGPHYYRIHGPDLLIEYDNTENNGNHIHTVWRSAGEDFGGDPVAEHYHDPNGHHNHPR